MTNASHLFRGPEGPEARVTSTTRMLQRRGRLQSSIATRTLVLILCCSFTLATARHSPDTRGLLQNDNNDGNTIGDDNDGNSSNNGVVNNNNNNNNNNNYSMNNKNNNGIHTNNNNNVSNSNNNNSSGNNNNTNNNNNNNNNGGINSDGSNNSNGNNNGNNNNSTNTDGESGAPTTTVPTPQTAGPDAAASAPDLDDLLADAKSEFETLSPETEKTTNPVPGTAAMAGAVVGGVVLVLVLTCGWRVWHLWHHEWKGTTSKHGRTAARTLKEDITEDKTKETKGVETSGSAAGRGIQARTDSAQEPLHLLSRPAGKENGFNDSAGSVAAAAQPQVSTAQRNVGGNQVEDLVRAPRYGDDGSGGGGELEAAASAAGPAGPSPLAAHLPPMITFDSWVKDDAPPGGDGGQPATAASVADITPSLLPSGRIMPASEGGGGAPQTSAEHSDAEGRGALQRSHGSVLVVDAEAPDAPPSLKDLLFPAGFKTPNWLIEWSDIRVLGHLGAGSYGVCLSATYKGTPVAVKRMLVQDDTVSEAAEAAAMGAVVNELELLAGLGHPHVVQFLGACFEAPYCCLVMEHCARGSLQKLLYGARGTRQTKLTPKLTIKFALHITRAMEFLHSRDPPVVHKDLKPGNLLVTKSFDVKVCDFGVSRIMSKHTATATNSIGTPHYAAPEVLAGEGFTAAVDVWSFGVILWELLAQAPPYADMDNVFMIIKAVLVDHRALPPVPSLPRGAPAWQGSAGLLEQLSSIQQQCCQRGPRLRPSFAHLQLALTDIDKQPAHHPAPPAPAPDNSPDA